MTKNYIIYGLVMMVIGFISNSLGYVDERFGWIFFVIGFAITTFELKALEREIHKTKLI